MMLDADQWFVSACACVSACVSACVHVCVRMCVFVPESACAVGNVLLCVLKR